MKDLYIIKPSEDGPTSIHGPFTEEEVLKRVTPNAHGETYYGSNLKFLTVIPDQDGGCWSCDSNCIMIIRGRAIVPQVVSVATKLAFPE